MARLYGEPGAWLKRRLRIGLITTIVLLIFLLAVSAITWRLTGLFSAEAILLLAMSMLFVLLVLTSLLVYPSYKGIAGERRVAEELSKLPDEYAVFFNVPLGRLDADAVAVGPTGVYAIEVKNWGNCVLTPLRSGRWLRTPRHAPLAYGTPYEVRSPTRQAKAAAARLHEITGRWVHAVVALPETAEFPPSHEGVKILPFSGLRDYILGRERALSRREAEEVEEKIIGYLRGRAD